MSYIINLAATQSSDEKTQERQRVTPQNIPGGQRVGPNIIEDGREDAVQQLRKRIRKKEK